MLGKIKSITSKKWTDYFLSSKHTRMKLDFLCLQLLGGGVVMLLRKLSNPPPPSLRKIRADSILDLKWALFPRQICIYSSTC